MIDKVVREAGKIVVWVNGMTLAQWNALILPDGSRAGADEAAAFDPAHDLTALPHLDFSFA